MLKKQFQLNLREQEDFFSRSKKQHFPQFSFYFTPADSFQATVIVPKKVKKLATERNTVKRKYRAALQNSLSELESLKLKVAVVVHPRGADLSTEEITQLIQTNAEKIRL